jgi:hypothetical protein
MPFFLIESGYENEHGLTPADLRAQAYGAMLSGAAGHVFGNNPIWHFDGPGLYPAPVGWQQALGGTGTLDVVRLQGLLMRLPWWRLEPDLDRRLLTAGGGSGPAQPVAARADDGSVAIIYLPRGRAVRLRLDTLAGPRAAAAWYDPTSGRLAAAAEQPFPAEGSRTFVNVHLNSAAARDWVLVLQSRS